MTMISLKAIAPKKLSAITAACVIALASFATTVQANDGTASKSTGFAKLTGKGTIGAACHADQGNDHVYTGKYKEVFGKLRCNGPTGVGIDCTRDDATCADGEGKPG
jgi:hypothetical protein